ncbi:hypothetical protein [Methanobrevibacter sp.]|jgi:hypothetical protein
MDKDIQKRIEKILNECENPEEIKPSPYERFRPYKKGKRGGLTSK